MNRHTQVINQLIAGTTSFIVIADAFTITPVDFNDDIPALFVYPSSETTNINDSAVSEKTEYEYVIQLVCKLNDLDALREEIKTALVGFQLSSDFDPMIFTNGQIEPDGLKSKHIWWTDVYRTFRFYRTC